MSSTDLVLVVPNLGDGGTQRVVTVLASEWSARGQAVCVVTLYPGDDVYSLPPGVRRIALTGEDFPALRRLRDLAAWIRARVPAAVSRRWTRLSIVLSRVARDAPLPRWVWRLHVPTVFRVRALRRLVSALEPRSVVGFCGSTNLITILACAGRGPRVVISERNDPSRQALDVPWQQLRPKLYPRADVVTANSRGVLESMRSYVPAERLRFAPNPLWQGTDGGVAPVGDDSRRILIVARLHRQKAHDVLFTAIAQIMSHLERWRVSVVGDGDEGESLRRLAGRLGIADRVDWFGQVHDPYAHYRSADLFVLPSRHEGLPNALLEAMSVGLPVIVSDASPGPLELVRHGENGWVVPVDDVGALAEALRTLVVDAGLRARLGRRAAESVEPFRAERVLVEWDTFLEGEGDRPGHTAPTDRERPILGRAEGIT